MVQLTACPLETEMLPMERNTSTESTRRTRRESAILWRQKTSGAGALSEKLKTIISVVYYVFPTLYCPYIVCETQKKEKQRGGNII